MTDSSPWTTFDPALPFVAIRYGSARARMAVFGVGDDDHGRRLLVVSPGAPFDDARHAELARWGRPAWLLAPNHFHNAGIAAWKARYPDARVVAHPRALPRLRRQVPGVAFEDLSGLEAELPAPMRLLCPPGARQGEVWVSLRTPAGVAWFVTDALVNESKLVGPAGAMLWLAGFRARLMTNPLFKTFFLDDRAAYRRWALDELAREAPTLFVPAHGRTLEGPDTPALLQAAIEA